MKIPRRRVILFQEIHSWRSVLHWDTFSGVKKIKHFSQKKTLQEFHIMRFHHQSDHHQISARFSRLLGAVLSWVFHFFLEMKSIFHRSLRNKFSPLFSWLSWFFIAGNGFDFLVKNRIFPFLFLIFPRKLIVLFSEYMIRLVLLVAKVPKTIQDNKTRYRLYSSIPLHSSRSNSCCPETPFLPVLFLEMIFFREKSFSRILCIFPFS